MKYSEQTCAVNNSTLNVAHVEHLEHYVRRYNDRTTCDLFLFPFAVEGHSWMCFESLVISKGWVRIDEVHSLLRWVNACHKRLARRVAKDTSMLYRRVADLSGSIRGDG